MSEPPPESRRCRILYVSPLKALAVDVERNLRAPLVGIAYAASARAEDYFQPVVAIRTGDTPAAERARFSREPSDILITTPESLYLLLISNAREALRSVDTFILDEIHALVPSKRGAHLAPRSSAWSTSAGGRCRGSASRLRSVRSMRWRAFWVGRSLRLQARCTGEVLAPRLRPSPLRQDESRVARPKSCIRILHQMRRRRSATVP